jgi:hypothetical protein
VGFGVSNVGMLLGLLGVALPVVIHLLNRRRDTVVDWGAMQFLELGDRARRRIRWTELLLMLARMTLLALVALALARPFWSPAAASARAGAVGGLPLQRPARDIVIVLDASTSMERKSGGTTPRVQAVAWARRFLGRLQAGDAVAVLVAGDRVRPLFDSPSFDRAKIDAALAELVATRGSSDLPAALVAAFGVLERTQNPARDIIVLTDGQRHAWRPGEVSRWALLRELHHRLPVGPSIWSLEFGGDRAPDAPNASLGPLAVSRSLATPGLPFSVTTVFDNTGPGPASRTAELLLDGRPVSGSAQLVGPVPAGGRVKLSFRASLSAPGSHLVSVRLAGGDDALPGDDESAIPIRVEPELPVLLVDGEPGLEPLSGETDFLRAALAPTGDDTPQVHTRVVKPAELDAGALKGQRAIVLANVEGLAPAQTVALREFLEAGAGILIAPGDRAETAAWNSVGWMPAQLAELKGNAGDRKTIAHPAPQSFQGSLMAPFAQGDSPPLAEADFFNYRVLTPVPGAAVTARLDTGDPWMVERAQGRGRVLLLATPIDAEEGTLPVNPDYVPLVHELIFHLAGSGDAQVMQAGEPLIFQLEPPPGPAIKTLPLETPSGRIAQATIEHRGASAHARFNDTTDSGTYRLALPDPPGGFAYAAVAQDPRESDIAPLEPPEAAKLSDGWPLEFEPDPDRMAARLFAARREGRSEIWRILVVAALAGLCLEIYLTRRLVTNQGFGKG